MYCSKIRLKMYNHRLIRDSKKMLHIYILHALETYIDDVLLQIVCPRSIYPFYIVCYYIKWVTTSWTYCISDKLFTLLYFISSLFFFCRWCQRRGGSWWRPGIGFMKCTRRLVIFLYALSIEFMLRVKEVLSCIHLHIGLAI